MKNNKCPMMLPDLMGDLLLDQMQQLGNFDEVLDKETDEEE